MQLAVMGEAISVGSLYGALVCEGQDGVLCQPAEAATMERPWGAQMSGSFPHSSGG